MSSNSSSSSSSTSSPFDATLAALFAQHPLAPADVDKLVAGGITTSQLVADLSEGECCDDLQLSLGGRKIILKQVIPALNAMGVGALPPARVATSSSSSSPAAAVSSPVAGVSAISAGMAGASAVWGSHMSVLAIEVSLCCDL